MAEAAGVPIRCVDDRPLACKEKCRPDIPVISSASRLAAALVEAGIFTAAELRGRMVFTCETGPQPADTARRCGKTAVLEFLDPGGKRDGQQVVFRFDLTQR